MTAAVKRLVLDTNIWLDWLVFADLSVASVQQAVATGQARIFISADCEAELIRVLGYPLSRHTLNPAQQAAALVACRAVAEPVASDGTAHTTGELPRCADPDDQKFLELARDCGAHCLLTRDSDLLVLARRRVAPPPFRIMTPRDFVREGERAVNSRSGD